jgi:hypothetical protein
VNVITFLGIVLTSAALFWWLARTGHDVLSSVSAALTVGYGAWRVQQLSHPQIVFTPLLPVALLCFARVTERTSRARGPERGSRNVLGDRILWLGAAVLAFQTLCTPSLAVYMLPLVFLWVCLTVLMAQRRDIGLYAAVAASFGVIAAINFPIARHYWALRRGLARSPVEVERFSARWADWISAPPSHWLYGNLLTLTRGSERELFPGFGFIAVAGIGVAFAIRRQRLRRLVPSLVLAGLALWLATGPRHPVRSQCCTRRMTSFRWYAPGGRQVRVPARFVILAGIFWRPSSQPAGDACSSCCDVSSVCAGAQPPPFSCSSRVFSLRVGPASLCTNRSPIRARARLTTGPSRAAFCSCRSPRREVRVPRSNACGPRDGRVSQSSTATPVTCRCSMRRFASFKKRSSTPPRDRRFTHGCSTDVDTIIVKRFIRPHDRDVLREIGSGSSHLRRFIRRASRRSRSARVWVCWRQNQDGQDTGGDREPGPGRLRRPRYVADGWQPRRTIALRRSLYLTRPPLDFKWNDGRSGHVRCVSAPRW